MSENLIPSSAPDQNNLTILLTADGNGHAAHARVSRIEETIGGQLFKARVGDPRLIDALKKSHALAGLGLELGQAIQRA